MSKIEECERQLFLKQLQINRLLDITQAINNNVKAEGLFDMYKSFLSWELGVRKLALFIPDIGSWHCVVYEGIGRDDLEHGGMHTLFASFGNTLTKLEKNKHPFAQLFDMVIPVFHKEKPIAYAFIGGYDASDFSKVQLITTITNITAVAIENKRLFKRQIEQERFNHEMTLAGEMQRALVPDKLPKNGMFEVSAIYKPHFGVGGDYFDCFSYSPDRYLFIVADIAGKGLAAALLMANFQANLHAIVRRATTPEEFIRQLNKAVWRVTKSERYITAFIADIDTQTRQFRYINAGHMPPILINKGKTQLLEKGCTILGFFESLPTLELGEMTIDDEALLLIFTDGITDVRNPIGADFNENLVVDFMEDNKDLTVRRFNEKLMERLTDFKGSEEYPDDITVLTTRFFKK
ncbi:MAG: serine/threonine-protein phosphatase [Saprospiraceae bacterium]|nr:serine/threonine-protein phosphatase [Saprospiraceae bacterium]